MLASDVGVMPSFALPISGEGTYTVLTGHGVCHPPVCLPIWTRWPWGIPLDEMQLPQPFVKVRAFQNPPAQLQKEQPDNEPQRDCLATFSVRAIFRQNASWQGSIRWMGKGKEEHFRSALEMLLLMDSVLDNQGKPAKLKSCKSIYTAEHVLDRACAFLNVLRTPPGLPAQFPDTLGPGWPEGSIGAVPWNNTWKVQPF